MAKLRVPRDLSQEPSVHKIAIEIGLLSGWPMVYFAVPYCIVRRSMFSAFQKRFNNYFVVTELKSVQISSLPPFDSSR